MDKDLDMSLFGEDDSFELNYDFDTNDFEQDLNDVDDVDDTDSDLENKKPVVEDDSSEEVDDEDDQDEGSEDDDESDSSSSNLYSSLAAFVHEQGLLPSLDIENTKIESPDDFAEAFKLEMTTQAKILAEQYLENLDLETIARSKAEINDLNSITEETLSENLEQAKQIVYQDYLNQGLDETKVRRMINRLVDLGEDAIVEEAKDSLNSLKEFNNRKIESEKAEYEKRLEYQKAEQLKLEETIKKTVFERKDLINGFTPNKAIQEKVYKSMNEIVGKSPEGVFENRFMRDRRENPVEFETRMYYLYELTDGFKDFSKISTKAKSSAVNDLEKIIKKGAYKDAGLPSWMSDKNSYDVGIGDELNL
jgi:hypothetical protein